MTFNEKKGGEGVFSQNCRGKGICTYILGSRDLAHLKMPKLSFSTFVTQKQTLSQLAYPLPQNLIVTLELPIQIMQYEL